MNARGSVTRFMVLALLVAIPPSCHRRAHPAADAAQVTADPAPAAQRLRRPVRGPEPEEEEGSHLTEEQRRATAEKMREEPPPEEADEPRDVPPEEHDAGAARDAVEGGPEPPAPEPGPAVDGGRFRIEDLLPD